MTGALAVARPPRVTLPVIPVSRVHLRRMTGRFGLFQHAQGTHPALEHGHCTDDMARLLMVDLRQATRGVTSEVLRSIDADLRFLEAAFNSDTGRFRNFRAATGEWLDEAGTEDSHGRAIQALGLAIRLGPRRDLQQRASGLLRSAMPAASRLRAPRPMAYVILGCLDAMSGEGDAEQPGHIAARHATRLATMIRDSGPDWPWPESVVTYDNGVIPQALIRAGRQQRRDDLMAIGLDCLGWLLDARSANGNLRPIGNRGWWARGAEPARSDQQPIEAASLLTAAAEALAAAPDRRWLDAVSRCLAWFLGANDMGAPLADPPDGSCRDGLGASDINPNRGAESTLAWLLSVEIVAQLATSDLAVSGLIDLPVG